MKTILIIDDNKLNQETAKTILCNEYNVISAMNEKQTRTVLDNDEFDLILLDVNMTEMDGFKISEKMRGMIHYNNIPIIFLINDGDTESKIRCIKEGAVDYIEKPLNPVVTLFKIHKALEFEELRYNLANILEQKNWEDSVIKDIAQKDALTGLWNRTYTQNAVSEMLEQGITGALMMLDVDNFKSVNDSYGHVAGDRILKMLADTLQHTSSEGDVLCRIGGDEFMVFMKDVTSKDEVCDRAMDIISELHEKIDACGFVVDTSVSIGIAQMPEDGTEFTKLYNCADKALYYVKRNGKDSYHFFSDNFLAENEREHETVDLQYLQERMNRTDNGNGAYLLNIENFLYVYNFVRRFVERSKRDVTLLLFTMDKENEEVMERLEKTTRTYLRRSDVTTRYSRMQLVVILMDANNENSNMVAERILENFSNTYPEETVQINHSIAHIDSRFIQKNSES